MKQQEFTVGAAVVCAAALGVVLTYVATALLSGVRLELFEAVTSLLSLPVISDLMVRNRIVAANVDGLAAAAQILGDLFLGHCDQVGVDARLLLQARVGVVDTVVELGAVDIGETLAKGLGLALQGNLRVDETTGGGRFSHRTPHSSSYSFSVFDFPVRSAVTPSFAQCSRFHAHLGVAGAGQCVGGDEPERVRAEGVVGPQLLPARVAAPDLQRRARVESASRYDPPGMRKPIDPQ
ncbi:hypothetical protein AB0E90_46760 [Actinoplanes sp. NPDC026619]